MWYKSKDGVLKSLYKPTEIYCSEYGNVIWVRSNAIPIEQFDTEEEAIHFIDYLFYEFGIRDRRTISHVSFNDWLAAEDWNK